MDLKLTCKKIEIDGWDCNYKSIVVNIDTVDKDDLNILDVAECISLDNMFDAHGEEAIKEYVRKNYDWFEEAN